MLGGIKNQVNLANGRENVKNQRETTKEIIFMFILLKKHRKFQFLRHQENLSDQCCTKDIILISFNLFIFSRYMIFQIDKAGFKSCWKGHLFKGYDENFVYLWLNDQRRTKRTLLITIYRKRTFLRDSHYSQSSIFFPQAISVFYFADF